MSARDIGANLIRHRSDLLTPVMIKSDVGELQADYLTERSDDFPGVSVRTIPPGLTATPWISRLWPGSSGKRENAWLPDISVELGLIIEQVENPDIRAGLEAIRDRLAAPRPDHAGLSVLSERELQALRYAALGLSNAEIAERMGLVAGTVKAYLRSVMRKLDSHNRMAAVNTARALGYPL